MSGSHTIQTTLEKLDKKPAMWKSLTIDELMGVVAICVISGCLFFILLFSIFGLPMIGFIVGFLSTLGTVPMLAGHIEKMKKKYGADLLWVTLKYNVQRRGWMSFSGVMTEKIRWDIRFSKPKKTEYTGPKIQR